MFINSILNNSLNKIMKRNILIITLIFFLFSCGNQVSTEQNTETANKEAKAAISDPKNDIGVGPITKVELGEFNQEMADAGKAIFDVKCTACHKLDSKYIGPALQGVINRRNPVWIMNMIMAPDKMIASDPIAKQLLGEANGAPMANQNLTETEARQILEYFRQIQ